MNRKLNLTWIVLSLFISCKPVKELKSIGSIERLDPSLDQIISPDANPEIIAEGFTWSEGPVWVESQKMLLFSDVPQDTVYKWTEEKGKEVYLTPSGYTGTTPTTSREPGSNGLLITAKGQLVLCQCGDRRLAVMNAPLDHPAPDFTALANTYRGKKFDSPNDAVLDGKGNFYMTDPPYGLGGMEMDPLKEAPYQGVYKITPEGKVFLLVDTLTKPNGIALSPDQKSLFIANSDPRKAKWYQYELGDTAVISGKVFFDITAHDPSEKGGPDGMKIDKNGIVFASGPGGIVIFNPSGKLIGKIRLPEAASNCALSPDEKTLYITADMYVVRLKMR
jgi:gluconolactonase